MAEKKQTIDAVQIARKYKYTDLHLAAENDDIEALKQALKANPDDINRTTLDCGNTPLMLAAEYNHVVAVELLIEAGANALLTNDYNQTAYNIGRKNENAWMDTLLRQAMQRQKEDKQRGITREEIIALLAFKQAAEEYCHRTNNMSIFRFIEKHATHLQPQIASRFEQQRNK